MSDSQLERQAALQAYREAAAFYKAGEFEKACDVLERLESMYPNHETVQQALGMAHAALVRKEALQRAAEAEETGIEPEDDYDFEDQTPLPDEAPDPDPFDTPIPEPVAESDSTHSTPESRARLPIAAIVLGSITGAIIGLVAGDPGDRRTEGAMIEAPALPAIIRDRNDLSEAYPGPLDTKVARAALHAEGPLLEAADSGIGATVRANEWSVEPEWMNDRLRKWSTPWGGFYEYRPSSLNAESFTVMLLHPRPPRDASSDDAARAYIEHPAIKNFSDRSGYAIVAPAIDYDRFPTVARGKSSHDFERYIFLMTSAIAASTDPEVSDPILLGFGSSATLALNLAHSSMLSIERIVACAPATFPDIATAPKSLPIAVVVRDTRTMPDAYIDHEGALVLDRVENAGDGLADLLPAALPHLVPMAVSQ